MNEEMMRMYFLTENLGRDIEQVAKYLKKQNTFNNFIKVYAIASTVYILHITNRLNEQTLKVDRLKKELKEFEGEQKAVAYRLKEEFEEQHKAVIDRLKKEFEEQQKGVNEM